MMPMFSNPISQETASTTMGDSDMISAMLIAVVVTPAM
jgi:hypothetical protein